MNSRLLALAFVVLAMGSAEGQQRGSATLKGTVMTDIGGTPVVGAEVTIPSLALTVVTDSTGSYSLLRVPSGSHEVQVRRLGYTLMTHAVSFTDGQAVQRTFYLNRPQTLDTVVVSDARPSIISFEEHRQRGLGKFITREELLKQEGRRLHEVLAQLPGAEIQHSGNGTYLANVRREVAVARAVSKTGPGVPVRSFCYPVIYLDGVQVYRGNIGEESFNINSIAVASIEAIEYYASASEAPMKYSPGQVSCGVLVIHTRRGERKSK